MDRQDISSIIASYINSNGPLDYQKDINVVSERILAAVVHQEKNEGLISEFNTTALIEELGKRRPCEKCENYGGRRTECINCLGAYIHYMRTATDNYKEAK